MKLQSYDAGHIIFSLFIQNTVVSEPEKQLCLSQIMMFIINALFFEIQIISQNLCKLLWPQLNLVCMLMNVRILLVAS